jgi:hypothetical protein
MAVDIPFWTELPPDRGSGGNSEEILFGARIRPGRTGRKALRKLGEDVENNIW